MRGADGNDDPAWLAWRTEGVTATDVADAMSGEYGGIYAVVARKQGRLVVEKTAEMERGHAWEATISDAVHVLTGWTVVGEETLCENADDPRWRATIDGFLAPHDEATLDDVAAVLEIKTRGKGVRGKWERWEMQTQWQMLVAGIDRSLIACATIDDNEPDPREKCKGVAITWVDANPALQASLVVVADTIWGHMTEGTLPDPDSPSSLEAVKAVTAHGDREAPAVDLTDLADIVARYAEIDDALKRVEAERDLLGAHLRAALGDSTKGVIDGYTVTYSAPANVLTKEAKADLAVAFPQFVHTETVFDAAAMAKESKEMKAVLDAYRQPVGARRFTAKPKGTT